MDEFVRQGIVKPGDGWKELRDQSYRDHFASLDDLYFFKGTQQLESLRLWTKGNADGVPGETPATRIEP